MVRKERESKLKRKYMLENRIIKVIAVIVFVLSIGVQCFAQQVDVDKLYSDAMKEYDAKNYKQASKIFGLIVDSQEFKISSNALYNGACIFALNGELKRSLKLLNYLVVEKFYSNLGHISTDSDLKSLHSLSEWKVLIERVNDNRKTLPLRNRKKIKTALLKAKTLLKSDNGNLWGGSLWHENVLFQDYQDTIYSLKNLEGSKTDDLILFYKTLPKDTLSKTNTVQEYNGEKYATILADDFYMNDESATIIHELFHRLHFEILASKGIKLKADPIAYLDNYDARELLRLEYQALRSALKAIDNGKNKVKIDTSIKDAFLFRKIRQNKYHEFLKAEVELETVEGLAAYTGFALSTYPNKYKRAISGINGWENSATYTRPFPYATGPAYGLIFDHLKLNWKTGLNKVYNFLEIYETKYLKQPLTIKDNEVVAANVRNNYATIHKKELARKILFEKRVIYYTKLFVNEPSLKVSLVNEEYSMSFDMNGTLILKDHGVVYSRLKGKSIDKKNFGDFEIETTKAKLGVTGVLRSIVNGKTTYTFPLPIKIEGSKITGKFYEIQLNEGWTVRKKNAKGDLELVNKIANSVNR